MIRGYPQGVVIVITPVRKGNSDEENIGKEIGVDLIPVKCSIFTMLPQQIRRFLRTSL
ncbi:hypothetical protein SAMN06265375_1011594 [Muriicola jejuensis]|uniref:Uncharacterized protein n=1 Tax=Muriicola jejuensis TaxID=504488 RepID=A0A6P0UBC1_9FLAO|nr:hypothetical protein [Muriicola jejuensis]NER08928.1 hypothetical protein [Muriicola jejuensis]SMP12817.1 hypothetical protein SAMN06265375_1011594 [Muriicola jejuensis]